MDERTSVLLFLVVLAAAAFFLRITFLAILFIAIAALYAVSSSRPARVRKSVRAGAAQQPVIVQQTAPAFSFPSTLKIKYKPDTGNIIEKVERTTGRYMGRGIKWIINTLR